MKKRIDAVRFIAIAAGLVILLPGLWTRAAAKDVCVECHSTLGGELSLPVEKMAGDIHQQSGFSCADCHGGDREADVGKGGKEAAMNPRRGYLGVPPPAQIPRLCAKCHSDARFMKRFDPNINVDQLDRYRTSVHGIQLAKGVSKVATCASCHGSHGVFEPNDPRSSVYAANVPETCARCHADPEYMKEFSIPTNQYADYVTSIHGEYLLEKGDISAPACNDCHGSHGAAPPGVGTVANVCWRCHPAPRERFLGSPHREAFEELEYPECVECHGNHRVEAATDKLVGVEEGAVCIKCHDGDEGFEVAGNIKASLSALSTKIDSLELGIGRMKEAGLIMNPVEFKLDEARSSLTKARNAVHSVSFEAVKAETGEGLKSADQAARDLREAAAELMSRRVWLVIVLVVIALVAAGLYLMIRRNPGPVRAGK